MAKRREEIKRRLAKFRADREMVKTLQEEVSDVQQPLISQMRVVDPSNGGIVVDPDDPNKGTAYVQQNDPSEVWDEDAILEYLARKSALRNSCMVKVLSIQKWEAEVAAGNVPPKIAARLKSKPAPPKPFIRFGKPGKDSK